MVWLDSGSGSCASGWLGAMAKANSSKPIGRTMYTFLVGERRLISRAQMDASVEAANKTPAS